MNDGAIRELFSIPNFLTNDFPVREGNFNEGHVTTVRTLADLPPWILERIPELVKDEDSKDEYVIKEYNKKSTEDGWVPGNFSVFDKFLFENDEEKRVLSYNGNGKVTVVDKATVLSKRQDHLRRYFSDAGRKFLLDSYFIPSANENDSVSLYEIQRRLPGHIFLNELNNYNHLSLSKEKKHKLVNNAIELKTILEKMWEEDSDKVFSFFLPDFHSNNIAITKDGNLVIFDINH